MENASKALLIAAAVLIVIIIITIGIKIYTSTGDTQKVAMSTGDTISQKTGEATELAKAEISGQKKGPIDYGKKTAETVTIGDDISIGSGENKQWFTVIKNDGNTVTAIAHYNIDLDLNRDIYQTENKEATTNFASYQYWNNSSNIDINYTNIVGNNDLSNTVNKYIKQYENTLKSKFDIKNVTFNIPTKRELEIISKDIRVCKNNASYWTRTAGDNNSVYNVDGFTGGFNKNYGTNFYPIFYGRYCVRPIIDIII